MTSFSAAEKELKKVREELVKIKRDWESQSLLLSEKNEELSVSMRNGEALERELKRVKVERKREEEERDGWKREEGKMKVSARLLLFFFSGVVVGFDGEENRFVFVCSFVSSVVSLSFSLSLSLSLFSDVFDSLTTRSKIIITRQTTDGISANARLSARTSRPSRAEKLGDSRKE
jgi:hypothetical protein